MNRLTTAAPASKADRPFGMRDKIGYALGDFGCQMSFALITAYLADFYTQYIGLTEATWAIIIIFLKIWDAVNDPIMGGIMDSRRISAKSKYKPWIRIGSFGLIVSGALAFLPIPHASYAMRVIVCVVTYLAWDIFYTLVNVPYGTLNSAISADPNERTQLSTYRSIGAGAGGLVTLLLPFFVYENNTLIGERFVWIGLIMGGSCICCISFLPENDDRALPGRATCGDLPLFQDAQTDFEKPPVACSVHCILCPARFLYLECADHKMGLSDLFSKHAAAHRRQPDRIHFLCGDDPLRRKNRPQVWQKAGGVGSAAH